MKKSRLLEIIREEISNTLTEAGLGDQISVLQKQKDAIEKQKAPLTKREADVTKKIADLEKKQADAEVKAGAQLEEDQLNEMAKITEPIRKAIETAVRRMEKSKPDITAKEAAQLIVNKKTQEKVAPEVKAALEADFEEKGGDPDYNAGIQLPQTLRAITKILGTSGSGGSDDSKEAPTKPEPKKSEPKKEEPKKAEPKKSEKPEPKKAEPKKAEPKKEKESSEEKAAKAAKGSSKLDKLSDDKDKLLKALKKAKEERLAVAEKRKNATDEAEREKLLDDLKKINKLEGELQNRIDKLKF